MSKGKTELDRIAAITPPGAILLTINRDSMPAAVESTGLSPRLVEIAGYLRETCRGTQYGISGIEDYTASPREAPRGNLRGMISIYSAEHNSSGQLRLIDSVNIELYEDGRVIAQCPDPRDERLNDICRRTNEKYSLAEPTLFTG